MKKYALPMLAVLSLAAPVALSSEAAAFDHRDRYEDRWDRDDDRRDRREDRWDRREDRWDRREDRWDRREDRWDRREDRWDRRRHNGYWYNNRFHWGPPPAHYYRHHSYRPGYRAWRRGDRVPHYYRDRYVVVHDYRRHRLYHPPRGYHWVRDDRGDYLLVGIATGVILGLILGGGY